MKRSPLWGPLVGSTIITLMLYLGGMRGNSLTFIFLGGWAFGCLIWFIERAINELIKIREQAANELVEIRKLLERILNMIAR